MSRNRVLAWLASLPASSARKALSPLHPVAQGEALRVALEQLGPAALDAVIERLKAPRPVLLVMAPTVFTASLEWIAPLLAAGYPVSLRPSRRDPRAAQHFVHTAQAHGLALDLFRSPLDDLPAGSSVVFMGSDPTASQLGARIPPHTQWLLFGHRISGATCSSDPAECVGLWRDVLLHDTRGCMSPVVVLPPEGAPLPLETLLTAGREAAAQLPAGTLTAAEGQPRRHALMRARLTGTVHPVGDAWLVDVQRGAPAFTAHPRVLQVVSAPIDPTPWPHAKWSTWGGPVPATISNAKLPRACALGRMQEPPLLRWHDGLDHWGYLGSPMVPGIVQTEGTA